MAGVTTGDSDSGGTIPKAVNGGGAMDLGWEFQFLVPISGTPIGSGIQILFLILDIPVDFFLISAVEKSSNWNSDSEIRNSKFCFR
jgi:hypothetical protein